MPIHLSARPSLFALLAALGAGAAAAQPAAVHEPIIVHGRALTQIGEALSASQGAVGLADFENRPIARVGELAENVPGLIATQHSGSGKANQYFLRGFNLDHGTDLAGHVDGAPVNMRSHGHGQGYLDLNFLIPELVERIDYTKGPYHVTEGDFSAAGAMHYTTRSRLARPMLELVAGSFGHRRALLAGSVDLAQGTVLGAIEATAADGPWVLDEDLRRVNALLKFTAGDWSVGLSAYSGRWTSTDQVPERAIVAGLIPRAGTIDADLGGRAGRLALTLNGRLGETRLTAYAIASRLHLVSNFTYFLDDPVNGDEFAQHDRRSVVGGAIRHRIVGDVVSWRLGAEARWDRIGRLALERTRARAVIATVRADRVDEYGGALYGEAEIALAPQVRLAFGLRGDAIGYDVRADLAVNSGSGLAAIFTPKAAFAWRPGEGVELYANYGVGYHSNDVRGAVIARDPASGEPAGRVPVFVRARGAELGLRIERGPVTASIVGFALDLASELVFVGDAGTTEPNDATRRHGAELALFWRPWAGVTIDGAAAWTHARFRNAAAGADHIPGATPFVLGGGISAILAPGLTGTARIRHFAGAPLIEDATRRAQSTTLVNLGAYWETGAVRLSLDLLNLLDASDPDISYWYASRLPGEPSDGIEDRHIHPVEPRQLRLSARFGL
jgi:outer membrane receptor protein involved in Fe transport